ncbi:MAG: transcription-repair coupling factor [Desulfobacterota bacterium]|nr:transcription-repair coupling factor [Thermodesulfobacteriota bacterium]
MTSSMRLLLAPSRPCRQLIDLLNAGTRSVAAVGLRGSAPALVAAQISQQCCQPVLCVAPTGEQAQELYHELKFFHTGETLLFPQLETQAYEDALSHCDVSSMRLWTLYRLCEATDSCIVVTSIRGLLQKVLPAEILIDAICTLRPGDMLDRDRLCADLIMAGYTRVSLVEDRGDLGVRGELLDVFPPGYDMPVRIDFFGDTIESIRFFDPATQRSHSELNEITLIPVREAIMSEAVLEGFRRRALTPPYADLFSSAKGRTLFDCIDKGFLPSGIDYCLAFLYPHLATLYDYLPDTTIICWHDRQAIEQAMADFTEEVSTHYAEACDERRIVPPPEEVFVPATSIKELTRHYREVFVESWNIEQPNLPSVSFTTRSNDDVRAELIACDSRSGLLASLAARLEQWKNAGMAIMLICRTASQCERVKMLLADYGVASRVCLAEIDTESDTATRTVIICKGELARGFRCEDTLRVIITEDELFGEKKRRVVPSRIREGIAIADFGDLAEGDYVVHRDNGIGVYRGLVSLEAGGMRADYLKIEYRDGDKLYLPVDRINLINKYVHTEGAVPNLDKLGGTTWVRTTTRVREAIEKIARDLIELYSARKVFTGHAFSPPDHYYREFEASFQYEETPDQLAAIEDVMRDMSRPMPMDRLICGDVGYGKTEVALRAAFRAAMDGKQVAVLVPTTVLAQQHYQTFTERFKPYPIRIEILSRFRTRADQKMILRDLAAGTVDIIIGTHRLLQSDVHFKDLGLIVIDEEHRFGVKDKEHLKKLRATVDVLTLTATPIPRTLQFSLSGIRDFSLIETPPEDRLAIRTIITRFDDMIIRDAILRELKRGGQIFFVHDRVRSIHALAGYLKKLVPEARLGIAHGQMNVRELEHAMMQFLKREIDLLLCTTIIESGLDFPTANTIIINNAHRLGLAQMYQLRGRVGRGKIRAYAYLLVPSADLLNPEAKKRLEALSEFSELGSGYRLATRDLQIRGAGNILGHAQSGHIAAVGMNMYLELLTEEIAKLKGEPQPIALEPEINLRVQAYIPDSYIDDVNQRLVLYRRIAGAGVEELQDIAEELEDRFGRLPPEVAALLDVARIKHILRRWMILSVDQTQHHLVFTFHEQAGEHLDKILTLVASDPGRFRFTPDNKLLVTYHGQSDTNIFMEIRRIFN